MAERGNRNVSIGTICEPIEVDPVRPARIDRVFQPGDNPAPARFPHFHDAIELVWFDQVAGQLVSEDGIFELAAGTLVFVPSMRQHDFAIGCGPQHWMVAHIDPSMLAAASESGIRCADRCVIVRFDTDRRARMSMLFSWLAELAVDEAVHRPAIGMIVNLLLIEISGQSKAIASQPATTFTPLDRLRPALEFIARDPAAAISLGQAATLCHLSDSYFSRRFKAIFGINFSDYLRSYRLRIAARRLLTSGARIADIAYETGFATPAHFTAAFRERYGVAPRSYRAQAQDRAEGAAAEQD